MAVCALKGCSNGYCGQERWTITEKEICELHGTRHDSCECSPPYTLFTFPSAIADDDGRNCWIILLCFTFTHKDIATVSYPPESCSTEITLLVRIVSLCNNY